MTTPAAAAASSLDFNRDELVRQLQNRQLRVGVLKGGMSTERNVSLKSGAAVAGALRARGYDVVEIDVGPDTPEELRLHGVEVAWIALHGAFGEDGAIQGLLEIMRIPYTGSDVRGSAVAMDKIATKRMLRGSGVRMADDHVWSVGDPIPEGLTFPVFAKNPTGGSTIGVFRCTDAASLEGALVQCVQFGAEVLIEQEIKGEEITVAVLEGRALPVVAIRPTIGTFDFEAKYTAGKTEYIVPAPIAEATAKAAQERAVLAYKTLDLHGVARADFIVDADGEPWFLEINTIPGMTATSLSPMAAGAIGMSFEDLVETLLLGARLYLQRAPQAQQAKPGAKGHA
jgi:D-alanine-D-alanine ligase